MQKEKPIQTVQKEKPTQTVQKEKPIQTPIKQQIKNQQNLITNIADKPKKMKNVVSPMLYIDIDLDNIPSSTSNTSNTSTIKSTIKQDTQPKLLQTQNITFKKAIKLTQLYYNNSDYKNSIKWAKIASNINNEDERVWKYYALSLEQLGQKEQAIYILKTYLKYKNSIELKYILQRLEK